MDHDVDQINAEIVKLINRLTQLAGKSGGDTLQGVTANFVQGLPDAVKADLLLQMPIAGGDDPDGPINKRFALECAEHLGPDWAQAWYHFSVFMTKVA